jgi:hypothetical protein
VIAGPSIMAGAGADQYGGDLANIELIIKVWDARFSTDIRRQSHAMYQSNCSERASDPPILSLHAE